MYSTLPLYFYYNPKRNGLVQVIYGNGNRISNGHITDDIREETGDSVELKENLHLFDDNFLTVSNNVVAFDWLEINSGFTYHQRKAYHPEEMRMYGKPEEYRSFAPMLSLKLRPWRHGPTLSIDYERGIDGVLKSDCDYERWEFDASIKHIISPLKKLNARLDMVSTAARTTPTSLTIVTSATTSCPKAGTTTGQATFNCSTAGGTMSRATTPGRTSAMTPPSCSPRGFPSWDVSLSANVCILVPWAFTIRGLITNSATGSPQGSSP